MQTSGCHFETHPECVVVGTSHCVNHFFFFLLENSNIKRIHETHRENIY
jgi:hypothetical protein